VLTDWEQYRRLDYRRLFDAMVKPAFLFDGRNCLDHRLLHAIGFNVYPIGKQPLTRL
jgi:UDPglucose 6-dehydrogenase